MFLFFFVSFFFVSFFCFFFDFLFFVNFFYLFIGIICGDVGLLSRSVRVRGGDADVADSYHSLYEHEFGATITITRRATVVAGDTKWERGNVNAKNIGMFDCGQGGFDDRHCFYFMVSQATL